LFVLSFLTWRKSQWMAITCQEVWGNWEVNRERDGEEKRERER
jgi:hypothetical protein